MRFWGMHEAQEDCLGVIQSMNVAELSGEQLDYWMYLQACNLMDKTGNKADFDAGYSEGKYHFLDDRALLMDLVETYQMNIQRIAGDWLASSAGSSFYGDSPLVAACRLVVALTYGKTVDEAS